MPQEDDRASSRRYHPPRTNVEVEWHVVLLTNTLPTERFPVGELARRLAPPWLMASIVRVGPDLRARATRESRWRNAQRGDPP